jgi:hypothetical protein
MDTSNFSEKENSLIRESVSGRFVPCAASTGATFNVAGRAVYYATMKHSGIPGKVNTADIMLEPIERVCVPVRVDLFYDLNEGHLFVLHGGLLIDIAFRFGFSFLQKVEDVRGLIANVGVAFAVVVSLIQIGNLPGQRVHALSSKFLIFFDSSLVL